MKKNFILALLLALFFSCLSQNKNNMTSERLSYFSFDHHNSMSMIGEKYNVSMSKEGRIHIVIDEGLRDEKELYTNDITIFDSLLAIVKKFNMDKYKSDYKPKMQVFDGDSWNLYYKYDTRRSVSSGGYMAWPDNYRDAREALSNYFEKWRNFKQGESIETADGIWAIALEIDFFEFTCKNNQGRDIVYTLERGEKHATVTIRDAEQGINETLKVSNDVISDFNKMANEVRLKSSLYDYSPTDPDATFCTYFVRYNTNDTVSGKTGYTKFVGNKASAILDFFGRLIKK